MKEVSVMSILLIMLILLATFFAVLTVWAGCRLHRLLSRQARAAERQRQSWACNC